MRVSLDWLKDFAEIKCGLDRVRDSLTMTGLEVTSTLDLEGDSVMDIEVTPNRPACPPILGLAREPAASQGKGLQLPD